jgi:hypothetical protein
MVGTTNRSVTVLNLRKRHECRCQPRTGPYHRCPQYACVLFTCCIRTGLNKSNFNGASAVIYVGQKITRVPAVGWHEAFQLSEKVYSWTLIQLGTHGRIAHPMVGCYLACDSGHESKLNFKRKHNSGLVL